MAKRLFHLVAEREGGAAVLRYRLTCGSCGRTEALGKQNMGDSTAQEQVPKKFEARGWEVGSRQNGRDDRCPACVARAAEQRRRAKLTIVTTQGEPAMSVTAPKAEPPREMDRTDRRLIIEKLSEVYIDEERGYDTGWSDSRIAEALGVPRAWVAKLRDENFGPARSEEVTRFLAEAETVRTEARDLRRDFEALSKRMAELSDRAGRIERAAVDIQKAVV